MRGLSLGTECLLTAVAFGFLYLSYLACALSLFLILADIFFF